MTARNARMTPASRMVIGKLRVWRQLAGLSAQTLADKVTGLGFPVTRNMVTQWETHRVTTVPVDFLILGAEALGMSAAELLTEPAVCPTCQGEPAEGFTCNTCGAGAGLGEDR